MEGKTKIRRMESGGARAMLINSALAVVGETAARRESGNIVYLHCRSRSFLSFSASSSPGCGASSTSTLPQKAILSQGTLLSDMAPRNELEKIPFSDFLCGNSHTTNPLGARDMRNRVKGLAARHLSSILQGRSTGP